MCVEGRGGGGGGLGGKGLFQTGKSKKRRLEKDEAEN